MTKYKIVCKNISPLTNNRIAIPDVFDTVFDACKFIVQWDLSEYDPEVKPVKEEFILEQNSKYDLTDDGKGKKYDNGKSMVGTLCRVFPRALLSVGNCIEFGTHKYPKPDNWKKVEGAFTRYQDSLMRHYLKFLGGETRDNETNILHLAHMAWNTLAILELYLMEHKEEFDGELFK